MKEQNEEHSHPLREFLKKGEGENIEFKQTIHDEYKIAKTICSFANTSGGTILIGVRDNKSIAGIDPEEEQYLINKAAGFHCRPPVPVIIEEVYLPDGNNEFEETIILRVVISQSDQKPHYAENKNGEWIPYLRQQDQTLIAGPQSVNLMQRKGTINSSSLTKNEKRLVEYLEKNQKITLKEFTNLVNISDRRARRELLDALNKRIIKVLEHEKLDVYVL